MPCKPNIVKQALLRIKLEVKTSWEVQVKLYWVCSKAVQAWKKLAMNIHPDYIMSLSATTVKTFQCLLPITFPFISFTNHAKTVKTKSHGQEPHKYHHKVKTGQNFICIPNHGTPAQFPSGLPGTQHGQEAPLKFLLPAVKQAAYKTITQNRDNSWECIQEIAPREDWLAVQGWLWAPNKLTSFTLFSPSSIVLLEITYWR